MKRQGTIYIVQNHVNGKCYIGYTTLSVERRWGQHLTEARTNRGSYLHSAIRKYGIAAFSCTSLYTVLGDRNDLLEAEKSFIADHSSLAPNGYNLTKGGDGVDYTVPEVRHRHKVRLAEARANNPEWLQQVHDARNKALSVLRQKKLLRDAELSPEELSSKEHEREFWRSHEARKGITSYVPEKPLTTANQVKQERQKALDATLPPEVLEKRLKDRARKKTPPKDLSSTWRQDALKKATSKQAELTKARDATLSPEGLAKRLKQRAWTLRSRAKTNGSSL